VKNLIILIFLLVATARLGAQELPPVFDKDDKKNIYTYPLKKVYISPKKILWKSDDSGKFIINVEALLNQKNNQLSVNDYDLLQFNSSADHKPAILLDYGKEIHGGVKISMGIRENKSPVKLRLRFGESVGEAMSDIGEETNATNDHSLRDFIIEIPWLGSIEVGETGFRFLRIDVIESKENIPVKSIDAAFVFREIPYLGSFECNDERLNNIWMTGAYTVHLNMQSYLWDGIKRDRLVWVGDMHPEVMTINTVFGKNNIVPKSLDLVKNQYPLPNWMNGISSYSMWWILIHKSWYDYHGDFKYLYGQKDYMLGLLDQLSLYIDENNSEKLDGNLFLDWPTKGNEVAVHAGLHALMVMTFNAGSKLMVILKEVKLQEKYKLAATKLEQHTPKGNTTKQASALLSLAGLENPEKINSEILTKDGVEHMSSFYGYYILEAMAKAKNYTDALNVIRDYWGAMLDLGATTFWEDFDINNAKNSGRIDELIPENKFDIHGDYGEHCYIGYRHSLCHGWASGPTPWLTQHILGINVKDGGNTIELEPHLGDLIFAKGSFPTKFGIFKVNHSKDDNGKTITELDVPKGLKIIQNKDD